MKRNRQLAGFGLTLNNMALYGERALGMLVDFPGVPYQIPLGEAFYQATYLFSGVGEILGAPEARFIPGMICLWPISTAKSIVRMTRIIASR
jgi:hypothetical protein